MAKLHPNTATFSNLHHHLTKLHDLFHQELMAMREERADLRAQVYVMDQEKKSLELLINSQKSQETALKTHIQHLQEELENQESLVMQLTFKRQFTQDLVRLERSSLLR